MLANQEPDWNIDGLSDTEIYAAIRYLEPHENSCVMICISLVNSGIRLRTLPLAVLAMFLPRTSLRLHLFFRQCASYIPWPDVDTNDKSYP